MQSTPSNFASTVSDYQVVKIQLSFIIVVLFVLFLFHSSRSYRIQNVKIRFDSDLLPVGKCFESVIEALKSCVGDREVQRRSLETVRAGMDAGLQYFCKDRGAKLNRESASNLYPLQTVCDNDRSFDIFIYFSLLRSCPELYCQNYSRRVFLNVLSDGQEECWRDVSQLAADI